MTRIQAAWPAWPAWTIGAALCGVLAALPGQPVLADSPASHAGAEAARAVDLRFRFVPVPSSLAMRPIAAPQAARQVAAASAAGKARAGQGGGGSGSGGEVRQEFSGSGYKAIPSSKRDLQERVIFRLNVGYGLDSGSLSGVNIKSGFNPAEVVDRDGNEFAEFRNFLLGDAVLGSRGILLPSLNSYIQSRFAFDVVNGTSEFAGLTSAYDRQQLQVNAAYAELDGIGEQGSPLRSLFVRAGRQYRYGSARFVTMFDGITAAFDNPALELSGFFGQRASVFFDDNPGLVGGAGVKIRGKALFKVPVDLAADYLYFDGGGSAVSDALGGINVARQYIELYSRIIVSDTHIYLRGRIVDNGDLRGSLDEEGNFTADGIGLGRVSVQVRRPLGQRLLLVADAEQRFAREAAFDYISPVDIDVVDILDTPRLVGLGLEPYEDSTLLGARLNAILDRNFEVYAFARVNIVPDDSQSGFNRPYQDLGAALSARLGQSFFTTAQYKLRLSQLDDDANGAGSDFFDTGGSGVTSFQELAGDVRYRLGGNARRASAGVGAYFRVYNVQSPYAKVEDDGRAGGRFDVDYWYKSDLRFKVAGEVAQPSPTFAPEIDTLLSIRAITEVLF